MAQCLPFWILNPVIQVEMAVESYLFHRLLLLFFSIGKADLRPLSPKKIIEF